MTCISNRRQVIHQALAPLSIAVQWHSHLYYVLLGECIKGICQLRVWSAPVVGSEEDEDGGVHDVRHEQDDGKREEEHGLWDDVQMKSAVRGNG